ncbi:hypothetical protein LWI28_014231 [Acer negundo]|uniref:Uncharacterized protein n=1 Tax=Acer negundo TaxID=4023 RepID=A0AAD5NUL4_ACENE|nr:hypothetical protein LWI28_014231 [Acer negundo]
MFCADSNLGLRELFCLGPRTQKTWMSIMARVFPFHTDLSVSQKPHANSIRYFHFGSVCKDLAWCIWFL